MKRAIRFLSSFHTYRNNAIAVYVPLLILSLMTASILVVGERIEDTNKKLDTQIAAALCGCNAYNIKNNAACDANDNNPNLCKGPLCRWDGACSIPAPDPGNTNRCGCWAYNISNNAACHANDANPTACKGPLCKWEGACSIPNPLPPAATGCCKGSSVCSGITDENSCNARADTNGCAWSTTGCPAPKPPPSDQNPPPSQCGCKPRAGSATSGATCARYSDTSDPSCFEAGCEWKGACSAPQPPPESCSCIGTGSCGNFKSEGQCTGSGNLSQNCAWKCTAPPTGYCTGDLGCEGLGEKECTTPTYDRKCTWISTAPGSGGSGGSIGSPAPGGGNQCMGIRHCADGTKIYGYDSCVDNEQCAQRHGGNTAVRCILYTKPHGTDDPISRDDWQANIDLHEQNDKLVPVACPAGTGGGGGGAGGTGGGTGGTGTDKRCLCEGSSATKQSCRSVDTKTKCGSMTGCSWNCRTVSTGGGGGGGGGNNAVKNDGSGAKSDTVSCTEAGVPINPPPAGCPPVAGTPNIVLPADIAKAAGDIVAAYGACGNPKETTIDPADRAAFETCMKNELRLYDTAKVDALLKIRNEKLAADFPAAGQKATKDEGFVPMVLALVEGGALATSAKDCTTNKYRDTIVVNGYDYNLIGEGAAAGISPGDIAWTEDCTAGTNKAYIVMSVVGGSEFATFVIDPATAGIKDLSNIAKAGYAFYSREVGAPAGGSIIGDIYKTAEHIHTAYGKCGVPPFSTGDIKQVTAATPKTTIVCMTEELTKLGYRKNNIDAFLRNRMLADLPQTATRTEGVTQCSGALGFAFSSFALSEVTDPRTNPQGVTCAAELTGKTEIIAGSTTYVKLEGDARKNLQPGDLAVEGDGTCTGTAGYGHVVIVKSSVSDSASFIGVESDLNLDCKTTNDKEHVKETYVFFRNKNAIPSETPTPTLAPPPPADIPPAIIRDKIEEVGKHLTAIYEKCGQGYTTEGNDDCIKNELKTVYGYADAQIAAFLAKRKELLTDPSGTPGQPGKCNPNAAYATTLLSLLYNTDKQTIRPWCVTKDSPPDVLYFGNFGTVEYWRTGIGEPASIKSGDIAVTGIKPCTNTTGFVSMSGSVSIVNQESADKKYFTAILADESCKVHDDMLLPKSGAVFYSTK